jgi:hypothetical protein
LNIKKLLEFQENGFDIQNYVETPAGNKPTTKAFHVPYSVYFFSCNLDHFICGDANLDKYKKITCADTFAREHGNDIASFAKYLHDDSSAVKGMSSTESWDMIMDGCNSLKRYTNINLLVTSLLDTSTEELSNVG